MRSRRSAWLYLALVIVIVTATPSLAKGPGSATIQGPGGTVTVAGGVYRYLDEDPFWDFQDESAVIALAFMDGRPSASRPAGDLGEPLTVTWDMGYSDIVQFLHMNAQGGPVTYIEPDPANGVRGGWHKAGPGLAVALEELGIEIPPPSPWAQIARILLALTVGMTWKT
ncbi:MAG: hypothetical protein WD651_15350 [Acidimicrobiia bacterium]